MFTFWKQQYQHQNREIHEACMFMASLGVITNYMKSIGYIRKRNEFPFDRETRNNFETLTKDDYRYDVSLELQKGYLGNYLLLSQNDLNKWLLAYGYDIYDEESFPVILSSIRKEYENMKTS